MPFIIISFEGGKSTGGYLRIDGGSQIALSDDLLIAIDEGTHRLDFSNKPAAISGLTNLNAALGNERTAAWMDRDTIEGSVTENFGPRDVMILSVVSDHSGNVIEMPSSETRIYSDEKYEELIDIYNARISIQDEYENKTVGIELLLCFFLGTIGAHKFYRKQFGWGIAYLFTGGLFMIGWFIDTVKLLMRFIKSRKA